MQKQIHVRVYGYLWSGARACYRYSQNITKAPKTESEAESIASDFASLIDWHVIEETNEYESAGRGLLRRIDTFKTLRGWRNGFSNRRYDRAVNA